MCLGVSLAAIMALVIYVGFFWYLEQQRQLKGKSQKLSISFGSVEEQYIFIFKRYVRIMTNSNQNVFKWPKWGNRGVSCLRDLTYVNAFIFLKSTQSCRIRFIVLIVSSSFLNYFIFVNALEGVISHEHTGARDA